MKNEKKNTKLFKKPNAEVITFVCDDVITTSIPGDPENKDID